MQLCPQYAAASVLSAAVIGHCSFFSTLDGRVLVAKLVRLLGISPASWLYREAKTTAEHTTLGSRKRARGIHGEAKRRRDGEPTRSPDEPGLHMARPPTQF